MVIIMSVPSGNLLSRNTKVRIKTTFIAAPTKKPSALAKYGELVTDIVDT
jgi:hypothetical protein